MKIKRIFLIVLDSFGIGAMPDAGRYGDAGSNTLAAVMQSSRLNIPNLTRLGLFNIDGTDHKKSVSQPEAAVARLAERSAGKDTTTGHWEIAGIVTEKPFPTYPHGFPADILHTFEQKTGRKVLCNKPYSGTQVILDYGQAHLQTGALIVYTSGDSVFQIAAHEDIVPKDQLYAYCKIAREILTGEHAVGRVIARPFTGEYPGFRRTENRRDFSLSPPEDMLLNRLCNHGLDVISVGKIFDIFNGKGITQKFLTHNNREGMQATSNLLETDFRGLCFVNLVDFDMLYGHRNDVPGYAGALTAFDSWLGKCLNRLCPDDILMITADHGCDPSTPSTDHSREYVPLLICGEQVRPVNLGTRLGFGNIAGTIEEIFSVGSEKENDSFASELFERQL